MERIRYRKLWGLFVACTVLASFSLLATPAPAHTPAVNDQRWNPQAMGGDEETCHEEEPPVAGDLDSGDDPACTSGSGGPGEPDEDTIVADTDAGLGSEGYALRALTDTVASFYEWYDCDLGTTAAMLFAPGAPCQLVAVDTTPVVTDAPPGVTPLHAWSGKWNITAGSEGSATGAARSFFGVACAPDAGTPGTGPPPNASHCTGETLGGAPVVPATIHVDDSSSDPGGVPPGGHGGGPPTSNGFIHSIVERDGTIFTGDQVHGAGLQNGQTVDLLVFTAPAGAHDAIHACWTSPNGIGGADGTPNGTGGGCTTHNDTDTAPTPSGGASCHPQAPTIPNTDCWRLTRNVPNLNQTFRVEIFEYDDQGADPFVTTGSGDCHGASEPTAPNIEGDDCHLNSIYVTTTAARKPPKVTPPPPPPRRRIPRLCDRSRPMANQDEILIGTNGADQICGFGGRDTLRGRNAPDTLRGGAGNDVLAGGNGPDNLRGGGGADGMRGGRGADTLRGAGGRDIARGGPGNDLCRAEIRRACER